MSAEPRPRLRSASWKFQIAGKIEPNTADIIPTGAPSGTRPTTHGITWTGTSWRWSINQNAES